MLSNIAARILKVTRKRVGMYISEMGGGLERFGSKMSYDVAYSQRLSRHRNIMQFEESKPMVENSWVASNSTLVGEVIVSPFASIWYNATLKAEINPIRIGSYSSIGDNTTINTHCAVPSEVPGSVTIGKYVTIQNNCIINSSIIDDEVFIGTGSVIGEGCRIEKGAVIAPNTLVPPGKLIPGRQMWSGNPAKLVRNITEEEAYSNYTHSYNIWNLAQSHLNNSNKDKTKDAVDIEPSSLLGSYLSENYFKWRGRYDKY